MPDINSKIGLDHRVGEIAAQYPLTTRVFARHGIDYCCGGGVALSQVCERKGLSAEAVLAELAGEIATAVQPERWVDAPSGAIVEHIVSQYHEPLREELPRLEAMAVKVAKVHADRDRDGRLAAIATTVTTLRGELEEHMTKEELELFPLFLQGQASSSVDSSVESLVEEHEHAGAKLEELRRLTENYQVPTGACTTWRALWVGLESLESTMHEHVHLENHVLFPRLT